MTDLKQKVVTTLAGPFFAMTMVASAPANAEDRCPPGECDGGTPPVVVKVDARHTGDQNQDQNQVAHGGDGGNATAYGGSVELGNTNSNNLTGGTQSINFDQPRERFFRLFGHLGNANVGMSNLDVSEFVGDGQRSVSETKGINILGLFAKSTGKSITKGPEVTNANVIKTIAKVKAAKAGQDLTTILDEFEVTLNGLESEERRADATYHVIKAIYGNEILSDQMDLQDDQQKHEVEITVLNINGELEKERIIISGKILLKILDHLSGKDDADYQVRMALAGQPVGIRMVKTTQKEHDEMKERLLNNAMKTVFPDSTPSN